MKFTWMIGGEAGFGIMTTGLLFSKIANRLGYYTFDYIEYPSLIRGGHNVFEAIVSDEEVHGLKKEIDFLVCLNAETYTKHKSRLSSSAYVIYDSEEFVIEDNITKISVPFKKTLSELKGQVVMKNTISMGASLAILGTDLSLLNLMIEEQFGKKGQTVVDFNKKFAEIGYNHVKQNYSKLIKSVLTKKDSDTKLVMTGNDAFSLGSVVADCRMYVAYPMTPSSSVLATMAAWQKKLELLSDMLKTKFQ